MIENKALVKGRLPTHDGNVVGVVAYFSEDGALDYIVAFFVRIKMEKRQVGMKTVLEK